MCKEGKIEHKAVIDKKAHDLIKWKWDERVRAEFIYMINSNVSEICM